MSFDTGNHAAAPILHRNAPCTPYLLTTLLVVLSVLLAALMPASAGGLRPAPAGGVVVDFSEDPLADDRAVFEGEAFDRLEWAPSQPLYAGDAPGTLTAIYQSDLPAGRVGWPLGQTLTREDDFQAVAVFVIDSEHLAADPFGYFQISWGLWNSRTTGMDRTGGPAAVADTYEMIEFDYYPNVSPFWGGPFLSPALFGVERIGGAFVNFSFAAAETELPPDVPLVATLEHRAGQDAVVVSVQRITGDGGLLPVDGAVTVIPVDYLLEDDYAVDTVGLTLWQNGWEVPGNGDPELVAWVDFHLLAVRVGPIVRPEQAAGLGAAGRR